MISSNQLEKVLPWGIKIRINCNTGLFDCFATKKISELKDRHNMGYDEENIVKFIRISFNNSGLDYNEFAIYVGDKIIYTGKGPDTEDETDSLIFDLYDFYMSIVNLLESTLKIWHDKIIEIQKANELKLKELEAEGYDEMLYSYYHFISHKRAFYYLKRLAERYPNSAYMRKLKRIYRIGKKGLHRKNLIMCAKLEKIEDAEYF